LAAALHGSHALYQLAENVALCHRGLLYANSVPY
jgi:hypothetical protein